MERTKLELEYRDEFSKNTGNFIAGGIMVMMTPEIDEDYWLFRVKLFKDQAIVAFPKFGTIGIGFALEEDWNTNLPYDCTSEEIYKHIRVNKKYKNIRKEKCIKAIDIIRKASKYYKTHELPQKSKVGDADGFKFYFEKMQEFLSSK